MDSIKRGYIIFDTLFDDDGSSHSGTLGLSTEICLGSISWVRHVGIRKNVETWDGDGPPALFSTCAFIFLLLVVAIYKR